MKKRWLLFCEQQHVFGRGVYEILYGHYTERHRAYHTLAHIAHCLREFDTAKHLAKNPVAVELALWFHEVIYDPWKKDNEELSALLAEEIIEEMDLSCSKEVGTLILATKHLTIPKSIDAQLVVECDLAILGQEEKIFAVHEKQIRKEYHWVPEQLYKEKRAVILHQFLDRPSLYATPFFREKYEQQARKNISQSLRHHMI